MRDLTGKIIILLYCVCSLMFVDMDTGFIVGLSCIIAVSCLDYVYYNNQWLCAISMGIYLLFSLGFGGFCLFYPIFFYDLVRAKRWYVGGGAFVILIIKILPNSEIEALYIAFGCIIAGFIAIQTTNLLTLEDQFKKIRDDSTEKNMLLEEKNRSLIESQNQEIYTATLKERNRIAREIHDNVGHMLTRSILLAGAVKAINTQENITGSLTQLEDTLHLAMDNVRESVHNLHDDSVDLQASVEEIIGGFEKCRCELDYDCGKEIPNDVKFSCIAIVKEALANVIKHSNATMVHIRLREHPALYQLVIDDNGTNGCGMERVNPMDVSTSGGMGLTNMRDRVSSLGGKLQLETEAGFHIFITIPKAAKGMTTKKYDNQGI